MSAPQTPWSPATVGVWKYGKPRTDIVRYLVRSSRMGAGPREDPGLAALLAECRKLPPEQAVEVLLDLYEAAAAIAGSIQSEGERRFWELMNFRHRAPHSAAVPEFAAAIMRRKLPLTIDHALTMMGSAIKLEVYSDEAMQLITPVVKLCEQQWSEWGSDVRVREQMAKLADIGRSIENAPQRKLVMRIDRLLETPKVPQTTTAENAGPRPEPTEDAKGVLTACLGLIGTYSQAAQYAPLSSSPTFRALEADVRELSREDRAWLLMRVFDELCETWDVIRGKGTTQQDKVERGRLESKVQHLMQLIVVAAAKKLPLTASEFARVLSESATRTNRSIAYQPHLKPLIRQLDRWNADLARDAELGNALTLLAERLGSEAYEERKLLETVRRLIPGDLHLPMQKGEAWTDAALEDIGRLKPDKLVAWNVLLRHCLSASAGSPSKKWVAEAKRMAKEVGRAKVNAALLKWLPLVDKPRTQPLQQRWYDHDFHGHLILDHHATILKGLCWLAATEESDEMARTLGALAISCYRKLPGVGARAVKVGNAAVYALGAMPGTAALGQLSRLRIKVKFGTAQAMIAKALDRAAEREGLPRSEIEELAVPAYGLEGVGFLREQLGQCAAEIRVGETLAASLHWFNDKAKAVKAVPAAAKREHGEEVKDLKGALKDVQAMLPAQRDRIDGLFLERKRWPLETWRERYLDHPLVGAVARRLVWVFGEGSKATAAAWMRDDADGPPHADGRLVRADGRAFEPKAGCTVTLWHPIDADAKPGDDALRGDVASWRAFYEDHRIRQPFKQAHREVYLLTDAERATETYSNRFAAHIVRQHQCNALMRERYWKTQTRLMVDADYGPAYRQLPAWDLRVEFWISGVGDDYNDQFVLDSGAFRYLATDQVRFYRAEQRIQDDDAVAMDQLPPIVLSECLRDADLFVGVASVGNNPEWADGGPEGRFQTYWQDFSFGTLGESAQTRRDILSRLIPRLAIADVCTLDDRYLVVKGTKRTYKIHLGSGNILMEPNDQYLCIVQGRADDGTQGRGVFLPFEGDRTLAIILSKAFMLAEDDKIRDRSILSQIGR